jgi:hypothetical protein
MAPAAGKAKPMAQLNPVIGMGNGGVSEKKP